MDMNYGLFPTLWAHHVVELEWFDVAQQCEYLEEIVVKYVLQN